MVLVRLESPLALGAEVTPGDVGSPAAGRPRAEFAASLGSSIRSRETGKWRLRGCIVASACPGKAKSQPTVIEWLNRKNKKRPAARDCLGMEAFFSFGSSTWWCSKARQKSFMITKNTDIQSNTCLSVQCTVHIFIIFSLFCGCIFPWPSISIALQAVFQAHLKPYYDVPLCVLFTSPLSTGAAHHVPQEYKS